MQLRLTATADEQLDKPPLRLQKRIIEKLELFSSQPKPLEFAEPLSGSNHYRFRIGDYRVIFAL